MLELVCCFDFTVVGQLFVPILCHAMARKVTNESGRIDYLVQVADIHYLDIHFKVYFDRMVRAKSFGMGTLVFW